MNQSYLNQGRNYKEKLERENRRWGKRKCQENLKIFYVLGKKNLKLLDNKLEQTTPARPIITK